MGLATAFDFAEKHSEIADPRHPRRHAGAGFPAARRAPCGGAQRAARPIRGAPSALAAVREAGTGRLRPDRLLARLQPGGLLDRRLDGAFRAASQRDWCGEGVPFRDAGYMASEGIFAVPPGEYEFGRRAAGAACGLLRVRGGARVRQARWARACWPMSWSPGRNVTMSWSPPRAASTAMPCSDVDRAPPAGSRQRRMHALPLQGRAGAEPAGRVGVGGARHGRRWRRWAAETGGQASATSRSSASWSGGATRSTSSPPEAPAPGGAGAGCCAGFDQRGLGRGERELRRSSGRTGC